MSEHRMSDSEVSALASMLLAALGIVDRVDYACPRCGTPAGHGDRKRRGFGPVALVCKQCQCVWRAPGADTARTCPRCQRYLRFGMRLCPCGCLRTLGREEAEALGFEPHKGDGPSPPRQGVRWARKDRTLQMLAHYGMVMDYQMPTAGDDNY